jgi:hypothetical protein
LLSDKNDPLFVALVSEHNNRLPRMKAVHHYLLLNVDVDASESRNVICSRAISIMLLIVMNVEISSDMPISKLQHSPAFSSSNVMRNSKPLVAPGLFDMT